ncbi:hypothetical protein QBC43DRAFT_334253 [Cladorrhinum sp. PSN259]|nr:hypothetical protein QBC43DRAFT_334253 [Cladorrhinum sp. PSN259]
MSHRKVRAGQTAAEAAKEYPYRFIEPDDPLDYSSGFDYSFDEESDEEETEVTDLTGTDQDQGDSALDSNYDYNYDDPVPQYEPEYEYDELYDEPEDNKSGWLPAVFTLKTLARLLVNALVLGVIILGLSHLPKIAQQYWKPRLDPSEFSLSSLSTAHRQLGSSVDFFKKKTNVNRNLRNEVAKLFDLQKETSDYPEDLRKELEDLLMHTINVAHQYHTFAFDVGNAVSETIKHDNALLKDIDLYEAAKSKTDPDDATQRYPTLKFVKNLIPRFRTQEGTLQHRIHNTIKASRKHIDTAHLTGQNLQKMIRQARKDIAGLVDPHAAKEESSFPEDHDADDDGAPAAAALPEEIESMLGSFRGTVNKLKEERDRLFAKLPSSVSKRDNHFAWHHRRQLSGLSAALGNLNADVNRANTILRRVRGALDKLPEIAKIDAEALLREIPADEWRHFFGKELPKLEDAKKWYDNYGADSYWIDWENDGPIEQLAERAGLRQK